MADRFLPSQQTFKQSFSLSDIDPNMEYLNHFPGLNPSQMDAPFFMGFPHDCVFPRLPELPGNSGCLPGLFIQEGNNVLKPHFSDYTVSNDSDRKRKATNISTAESSSANSSAQCSLDNGITKKNSAGKGKKVRGNGKEAEKPREVVHVRAKRGQATDNHSLAERVRRGKINERLRCLQDIVPGCYKTMGMAVMLDEIINYVQSLQNQVEFLSMKLTAASALHDFNSDIDFLETMQNEKTIEAVKIQNIQGQGLPSAQFGPLDFNLGNFPQLPYSR